MSQRSQTSKKSKRTNGGGDANISINSESEPDENKLDESITAGVKDALQDPDIRKSFGNIFGQHVADEVKKATSCLTNKNYNISSRVDKVSEKCDDCMTTLTDRLNSLERDSKKKVLRLMGVPKPSEAVLSKFPNKKAYMVDYVVKSCRELQFQDFSLDNVVSKTLVKTPGPSTNTDSLVLEFTTEKHKLNFYSQRIKFKGFRDEILTKSDSGIFKQCRMNVKSNKLHSTWRYANKVWAKGSKEGKPFCVADKISE